MQNLFLFGRVISFIVLCAAETARADADIPSSLNIGKCFELISGADVLIYGPGKNDFVTHSGSYRAISTGATSNLINQDPPSIDGPYIERVTIRGRNSSNKGVNVVALIPLSLSVALSGEMKENSDPIRLVLLNGIRQKSNVFLFPRKRSADISTALLEHVFNAFGKSRIIRKKLEEQTPLLFVNLGTVPAASDLQLDFEIGPFRAVIN